jgi:hypothetical protein
MFTTTDDIFDGCTFVAENVTTDSTMMFSIEESEVLSAF